MTSAAYQASSVIDDLYWSVGKCVWHIQYLEDLLHSYLALRIEIRERGRISEMEARGALNKHRRATLGNALNAAERHSVLPIKLLAELRTLKNERDWLVHRSMHNDSSKLKTKDGQIQFFDRLATLLENTDKSKAALFELTKSFCAAHGVPVAAIEAKVMAKK